MMNIWNATWQSSLVVLAVWALCRVFPKLPPTLRCGLWRLTLAKFLVALFFVAPAVLPMLPATPVAEPTLRGQTGMPTLSVRSTPMTALMAVGRTRDAASLPMPNNDQIAADDGKDTASVGNARTDSKPRIATLGTRRMNSRLHDAEDRIRGLAPEGNSGRSHSPVSNALVVFYVLGVSVSVASVVIQGVRTARWRRRTCTSMLDTDVLAEVGLLSERLNLPRIPALLTAPDLALPLLVGLIQPAIVLPPADLWESYTSAQRRLMLGHELAHLRRRDLLWMWLPTVVRILFFFDPFAYLAQREEDLARETACDALAIQAANATVADYGALLLTVAASWRRPTMSLAALGIASDRVASLRLRLLGLQRENVLSPMRLRLTCGVVALSAPAVLVPWKVVAARGDNRMAASSASTASSQVSKTASLIDLSRGSGVIEGRILLEPSATPGRDFCVALMQSEPPFAYYRLPNSVHSDMEGRYRIDHVPVGKYNVRVWSLLDDGSLSALGGDGRQPVTVGNGPRVSHLDFKFLKKSATIFGKITDAATGQPVTGLEIGATSADGNAAGITQWNSVDRDGGYVLFAPAGHAALFTRYSGGSHTPAPYGSPYRLPRSTESVRRPIETRLGQSQRIDFQVAAERVPAPADSLPPLMGQVLRQDGQPAAGAEVIVYCQSDTGNLLGQTLVRTDANGKFQWEGMPPSWAGAILDVRARGSKDSGLASQPMRMTLPRGGLTTPLTLHLAPNVAASVSGRVVDAAGHGIPDAPVCLAAKTLVRDDEMTLTDSEGRYQFTNIWPVSNLWISAEKDGYGRGGVFLDHAHPLAAGERRTMPSLVVQRTDKAVAGVLVRPGAPLSGGRIIASSLWSRKPISSATDDQGRFYIDDLPAGKVSLFYAGNDQAVSVQAGDTHVRIVFQHPGKRPPYYSY